jgi:hypothetical protein
MHLLVLCAGLHYRNWYAPAVAETCHTGEPEKMPVEHGEFNVEQTFANPE